MALIKTRNQIELFKSMIADRAKQIKCKAMVNEDPTEKLIADLKAENERLKNMIKSGKIDPSILDSAAAGAGAGGANGQSFLLLLDWLIVDCRERVVLVLLIFYS